MQSSDTRSLASQQGETPMLTIYGVPLSVHTRKVIITAIHKKIDYKVEVVIPVVPGNPPANWHQLSPTGLIPILKDESYTLADSTAICLYLEKKRPSHPLLPNDVEDYGRVLWFDAYAGGTLFRHIVHPLFHQMIVGPHIRKESVNRDAVDNVLANEQPNIFGYLDSQIAGKYLVGNALTLADIAIVSNFVVYQYLGLTLDKAKYPELARYVRDVIALEPFQRALKDEQPFVDQMKLDRRFLA
jgi:glutathione S-transferase